MKEGRPRHPQAYSHVILLALTLLLPATVAGCPEFRNQVVDAAETAVLGIILADEQPCTALETAGRDIAGAALDLFFDQFRVETTRF